jgi:hypothetical protein
LSGLKQVHPSKHELLRLQYTNAGGGSCSPTITGNAFGSTSEIAANINILFSAPGDPTGTEWQSNEYVQIVQGASLFANEYGLMT